jgi:hypothetical protein
MDINVYEINPRMRKMKGRGRRRRRNIVEEKEQEGLL